MGFKFSLNLDLIFYINQNFQIFVFRAKLLNARTWDALKTTRVIVCGNEYTTLKLLGKASSGHAPIFHYFIISYINFSRIYHHFCVN